MKKYNIILHRLISLLFAFLIAVTCVINLVFPDRKMSYVENRSLQTFPIPSISSLSDGSYGTSLTNWYSDQFVFRNGFIHLRYSTLKVMGYKKIDDVYLCSGRLIEECATPNKEQLQRNLNAINEFAQKYSDLSTTFMLIPNAVNVQNHKLPLFANADDQNKLMDSIYSSITDPITKIDVRSVLSEHKNEYLYYKTDHHWTSLAAFYTYQAAMNQLNGTVVDEGEYSTYIVSTKFKGTLANKTGSIGISDKISIYVKKDLNDYYVVDDATLEKSSSIYDSQALKTNDKYTVFLGGNKGIQHIEIANDSNRHLLIFKDSYANEYVQFLLSDYRTITIVDPRYYTEDIDKVVQKDLITDVLYLYNTNTFVEDTSLADVLE